MPYWNVTSGKLRFKSKPKRSSVEKSTHSERYRSFVHLLRSARQKANIRQVDLAERLEVTQSYVSKVEAGELRLDLVQLHSFCEALGVPLDRFV
jgi:ribosome-binding protein aMBF1 (putative translation factor)